MKAPLNGSEGKDHALDGHEEFRELGVLSLTEPLTNADETKLGEHLATCQDCRTALEDYRHLIHSRLLSLAPDFVADSFHAPWSSAPTKRKLFQDLASETFFTEVSDPLLHPDVGLKDKAGSPWSHVHKLLVHTEPYFRLAAIVFLVAGLGFATYRIGLKRGLESPRLNADRANNQISALQLELNTVAAERAIHRKDLADHENVVSLLTKQVEQQQFELLKLKSTAENLNERASAAQTEKSGVSTERDNLAAKLSEAAASLAANEKELEQLRQQRKDELLRSANLEIRIQQLSSLIKQRDELLTERDKAIDQQQQFLASDRDIRELMGARQLYIAEVYDVAGNGKTEKPFGRIFYTKGKSLIFYAYDLDQQSGVRKASAFQAWGRRGVDVSQPLNLGIMYVDNTENKRWALKFDDPERLAQIDAVFVTVEPHGGSRQPTGKRLLYAYLGVPPNHP